MPNIGQKTKLRLLLGKNDIEKRTENSNVNALHGGGQQTRTLLKSKTIDAGR